MIKFNTVQTWKNVKNSKISLKDQIWYPLTRFQVRGVDDGGSVANFVESEQLISIGEESAATSFVQVRGSVPIFWDQPGYNVGQHKIRLSRGPGIDFLQIFQLNNCFMTVFCDEQKCKTSQL